MIRKIFILAVILLAVNFLWGEQIESWWHGWTSGEKVKEFSQNLTNQAVDSVKQSGSTYSQAAIKELAKNLPKDAQLQIDNWLLTQNLNQYGDPEDTMYTGGTPTFDESTGEEVNRFELILEKFPELVDKFKLSVEEFQQQAEQRQAESQ